MIVRSNPLEGLSVDGVRTSFRESPATSALAAAAIAATAYWGLKSTTKKTGLIRGMLKGLAAVAVLKTAKRALTPERKALPASSEERL